MIVSLELLKEFCRIDTDAHDNLLTQLLSGAEDHALYYTGLSRAGGDGTTAEDVTILCDGGAQFLWPDHLPISSVVSITDTEDGTVLDPLDYSFDESKIWMKNSYFECGYKRYSVVVQGGINTTQSTIVGSNPPSDALKTGTMNLVSRAYNNLGGEKKSSMAGQSVDWMSLDRGNDIHVMLDSACLRPFIG